MLKAHVSAGWVARFVGVAVLIAIIINLTGNRTASADPLPETPQVALAAPLAVGPTVALSVPQVPAVAEDTVNRPNSPSSLGLLAVGLGFLFLIRSRHWVR